MKKWFSLLLLSMVLVEMVKADAPVAYGYADPVYTFVPTATGMTTAPAPGLFDLHRDGSSDEGIAWTEETVWAPDGSYQVMGSYYGDEALCTQRYYAAAGVGVYWVQLRVVDSNIDFTDYWYSFEVDSL